MTFPGFRTKLSTDQVNYLNIGLMVLAASAAYLRPFEVFLFAYAFLGPLHYLTEISWLHDRRYFTRGKNDYLFLVVIAGIIAITDMKLLPGIPTVASAMVTYLAFGGALIFVAASQMRTRLICFSILLATVVPVVKVDVFQSLLTNFLPSIIHVFVFTGLFILAGALKGGSASGVQSLVVFCLCAISFFALDPVETAGSVGVYVHNAYLGFTHLNYSLMTPFSRHDIEVPANAAEYARFINGILYTSPTALAIMSFIAFAYTYHYLNWFSKTSIIQWHNISRVRFAGVILIWIISVAAYLYDYRVGLRWLYFLSFTHVLLEFPLNHLSILNIGREFKRIAAGGAKQSA